MTDKTSADRWPEDRMHGLADLALALGGSEDSFTGRLLELIAKADADNWQALRRAFPRHVRAYEIWMGTSPAPHADELIARLDADPGARPDTTTPRLAKILMDLDRCPHGRHRIDPCLACPDGQSAGNPHMPPGATVGYDLAGRPYTAPDGSRSTSDPAAWRATETEAAR